MNIKINENRLNRIISESIKKALNENFDYQSQAWNYLNHLKDVLGAENVCDRLFDRLARQIDWRGACETLREIYEMEVEPYLDDDDNE